MRAGTGQLQGSRWMRRRIDLLRYRGYHGIPILGHRAFRTLPLRPWNLVSAAFLAFMLSWLWLTLRPLVGQLWAAIFDVSLRWLGIPAQVGVAEFQNTFFKSAMPQVALSGQAPGAATL